MKTECVAWSEFPWERKQEPVRENAYASMLLSTAATPLLAMPLLAMLLAPEDAHAAGGGWETAKTSVLHILDYVSYGVIVFSGGSWMFGHRNKALDLLLSCGIGTVIIRHADDIEAFFKSI